MDSMNNLYAVIGNVLYRYVLFKFQKNVSIYLSIITIDIQGYPRTKNVTSDTFVYYIIFTNISQLKTQFNLEIVII